MELNDAVAAAVFIVAAGAGLTAAAWRAAGRLVGTDLLDRGLVASVVGLGALCAVLQVLGVAGLLSRWPVTAALLVLATAVLVRVAPPPPPEAPSRPDPMWPVALAVGAGLAALTLLLGLEGITSETDTLQYHVPNAATWMNAGSLLELPMTLPGYSTNAYPSNHTLTGLWLMLATDGDQAVYAVNALWGLLSILGAAALTRTLGGRPSAGALLATALLLTPIVFTTQAASVLADLATAGGLVAAAACALRAARESSVSWALVAGVAVGLAAGSKYVAFLPAATVVALPLLLLGRRGVRQAVAIAVPAAGLVGFWLVRNTAEFGNPLFPLEAGPLTGNTSPLDPLVETPLADHLLAADRTVLERWLDLVGDLLGPAALLPVAAVVLALLAARRGRPAALVAAALVTVWFGAYLVAPYTGGGPDGTLLLLLGSGLRYGLPVLLLAAAVMAAYSGRWAFPAAFVVLVWAAVEAVQGTPLRPELDVTAARAAAAVVAGLAVAGLAWRRPRLPLPVPATAALATCLAGAAIALGLAAQARQPPTATDRLLADRCPGGRVAVAHVTSLRALLGRDLDVEVVGVDREAAAGRAPILDPKAADARVAELQPDLLVLSAAPTVARGWQGPPGWTPVDRQDSSTILAPPGGGCG